MIREFCSLKVQLPDFNINGVVFGALITFPDGMLGKQDSVDRLFWSRSRSVAADVWLLKVIDWLI